MTGWKSKNTFLRQRRIDKMRENHIRWFGHQQQGPISNQYKQVLQFNWRSPSDNKNAAKWRAAKSKRGFCAWPQLVEPRLCSVVLVSQAQIQYGVCWYGWHTQTTIPKHGQHIPFWNVWISKLDSFSIYCSMPTLVYHTPNNKTKGVCHK